MEAGTELIPCIQISFLTVFLRPYQPPSFEHVFYARCLLTFAFLILLHPLKIHLDMGYWEKYLPKVNQLIHSMAELEMGLNPKP